MKMANKYEHVENYENGEKWKQWKQALCGETKIVKNMIIEKQIETRNV